MGRGGGSKANTRSGGSKYSGRLIFFLIKENWIFPMTRHHIEWNINILLTRNLPIDSDIRQWSHSLMIPSHYLWAKLNNRTRGQFECGMTWFCFCFDFVCSHAWCSCCSIVCWRGKVRLKLNVQGQLGWERFGRRRTVGVGVL